MDETFAERWTAAVRQSTGDDAAASIPAAAVRMADGDPINLAGCEAHSASPAHAEAEAAACRTNRAAGASRQAARLTTWEDEGGPTAFLE